MRRTCVTLSTVALIALVVNAFAANPVSEVKWYGASDRAVAVNIGFKENDSRKNASGPKITSNAHSKDFPGIYFIWDSKQSDNGYLKVNAAVFDIYESFTLTSKESNKYFDFVIAPIDGQVSTADGCYVFYIPKVYNNKNINMVFIGEWKEKDLPPPEEFTREITVIFQGIMEDGWGAVHSLTRPIVYTSLTADVIPVEINWAAVYNAYASDSNLTGEFVSFTEERVTGWNASGLVTESYAVKRPNLFVSKAQVMETDDNGLTVYFKPDLDALKITREVMVVFEGELNGAIDEVSRQPFEIVFDRLTDDAISVAIDWDEA
ncbi:MAG: hypothetical protein FWH27_05515, partial [Planctomycetaceae bacterium]|nr:hypothetical protein [Planctomycetaceae bacterium]